MARDDLAKLSFDKLIEHEPNSDPPRVTITSVNPDYQAYERLAEEVHIVGRVVWSARRL